MNKLLYLLVLLFPLSALSQDRTLKINFETSSFNNATKIPYTEPFFIEGRIEKTVQYVKIQVLDNGTDNLVKEVTWNRDIYNTAESFSLMIPKGLTSNSSYDFKITTYSRMSEEQKLGLSTELGKRIQSLLQSQYSYDGSDVKMERSKKIMSSLDKMIQQALSNQISKTGLEVNTTSRVIYDRLEQYQNFEFKKYLRGNSKAEKKTMAISLVSDQIDELTAVILNEVQPFINSDLVQKERTFKVTNIETEKGMPTVKLSAGGYYWRKAGGGLVTNPDQTGISPGIVISFPFSNKIVGNKRLNFSNNLGYSIGVLTQPIVNNRGIEYVTPGIGLPVYAGLSYKVFKVLRFSVGTTLTNQKGTKTFKGSGFDWAAGLAFELDVWMGLKK